MLGDALVFPAGRSGWQKTVGAGGLLFAVVGLGSVSVSRFAAEERSMALDPVTIAVVLAAAGSVLSGIVLVGYHVRVLRSGVSVGSELPSFRPLGGLFSAGIGLCSIVFAYAVGPVALIGGLVWTVLGGTVRSPDEEISPAAEFALAEQAGAFVIGLATVVLVYVSLAAIARFAHHGRVRSAIGIRSVVRIAFTTDFFVGFVLGLGVWLVIGSIGVALSPIGGVVLVFYATVVCSYLIGRGYGTATGHRMDTGGSDDR